MKVKFKKLNPEASIPTKAHNTDAGFDLTATSVEMTSMFIEYGTGIAISIPENHVGLIFPRSSISNKNLSLANSVGVIDFGYHGEIKFRFRAGPGYKYDIGDRIGQLIIVPYPEIEFEEVSDFEESERNDNGFGSTGD